MTRRIRNILAGLVFASIIGLSVMTGFWEAGQASADGPNDAAIQSTSVQDNGSGSAAIPQTSAQFGEVSPSQKVRFAWWGAEESGLVGSSLR